MFYVKVAAQFNLTKVAAVMPQEVSVEMIRMQ